MLSNFVWCCLACLRNVRKPGGTVRQARIFASCASSSLLPFDAQICRRLELLVECTECMRREEKVQHAEKLQSSVIVLWFPNALSALAPSSFAFSVEGQRIQERTAAASGSFGLDVCSRGRSGLSRRCPVTDSFETNHICQHRTFKLTLLGPHFPFLLTMLFYS